MEAFTFAIAEDDGTGAEEAAADAEDDITETNDDVTDDGVEALCAVYDYIIAEDDIVDTGDHRAGVDVFDNTEDRRRFRRCRRRYHGYKRN